MGKAVTYTLAQWESLEVYIKEPEIEIDNHRKLPASRHRALHLSARRADAPAHNDQSSD